MAVTPSMCGWWCATAAASPDDLLPRIIEPFKGARNGSHGLGLRLYIVEQFGKAHGGGASVRNLPRQVVFETRSLRRMPAAPRSFG